MLTKLCLITLIALAGCTTFKSTVGPLKTVELTDLEAGYDQAAYDECMDSTDTTPDQCEGV